MQTFPVRFENKVAHISPYCLSCDEDQPEIQVSTKAYRAWRNGALIQQAMPELTSDERELLISGICPKCCDELYNITEDESF